MPAHEGRFPLTRHSVLAAVQSDDGAVRRLGWDALVRAYWKPIYKHLRLRWRADEERARDWTQEFFARAFEKSFFDSFDPKRARFRTFLRVCLDRFAANEHESEGRLKRGGGTAPLALDFVSAEGELAGVDLPAPDGFEERFHREWMRSLFEAALADLRQICVDEDRMHQFEAFRRYDIEGPDSSTPIQYADLARDLGVPVTQVTNWLHWARAKLRTLLLARLRELCPTDEEYREEARALFGVDPR